MHHVIKGEFLKRFYVFIFREEKGRRKREKHQYVVAPHTTPTGDLVCNPGMCPDWESNRRPFGSQAGTHSTEPHQPGPLSFFCLVIKIFKITCIISIVFPLYNMPWMLYSKLIVSCINIKVVAKKGWMTPEILPIFRT